MARPREFDETEVLRAAKGRFAHAGYAGTSLSDLTGATRLGKASLYGAFGDKRELFLRVLDEYCAGSVAGAREQLTGRGRALNRLRRYMLAVADASASHPDGCLLASSTAELAGQDEAVAALVGSTFAALSAVVEDCIRQAQDEGDLDADADPRAVAGLVLAVLRGMEALGTGGMSRRDLRKTAELAVRVLPRA
jgi:AcrR family transcriptional regulator